MRQQDYLAELLCAIAEKTFDVAEDGADLLFCDRNARVIRTDIIDGDVRYVEQPGSVWLHGVTLASRLRPCLVRLTPDIISLGAQFELQAHFGQQILRRKVRAHRTDALLLLCPLAKQGERNRAEDRRLS